jgi:hypothetical protein
MSEADRAKLAEMLMGAGIFENSSGHVAVERRILASVFTSHFREMVMQPHQQVDYERLRREGRWPEASAFRDAERKRLRAAGGTRKQAVDKSWQRMLERFPLHDAANTASVTVPADRTESPKLFLDFKNVPTFEQLLRWTVRFLGHDPATIDPAQVPHRTCIEFLKFANRDSGAFFGWLAKYDQEAKKSAEGKHSYEDEKRKHFKLYDAILADLKATAKQKISSPCCDESGTSIAATSS